jgi:hypothetical protein
MPVTEEKFNEMSPEEQIEYCQKYFNSLNQGQAPPPTKEGFSHF